ncbi:hypothetical protein B7P43_G04743 [Cryptotermes secundus]|uniref:RNA-directed DNA polymerase n=1 Tax=Cryptotermes secundus TaxID=105785 RepID=A0A2J7RQE8_9NEOP|nr:hypothetical protein B7P43_G04743 [Cryptotermes secundus]
MIRPLTQLTKKDEKFVWTRLQQQAVDNLKAALTSDSVLAHPRFGQPFILSTVASDYAISAILSQLHNGKERPISFASRMLNAAERNYSTTQKELLAVVFGTQIHRCFLYGRKFKIVSDQAALKWLITVKNHHCARLTRLVLKLSEYEFEIKHKAGKKHVNADCLSRHIASVVTDGDRKPPDDNAGEALTRHARLFVPETLRQLLIELHHDKVFAGHQGAKRNRDLVKLHYFWPNMDRDIDRYVKQCDSCAKFKAGRQPIAPLGELPETTFPFEMTSINFCGPYPETRRENRYVPTFIDHFSRYPEAIPIPRQDAPTVARALVTEIFSRLGCPQTLSSDKGSNFMSELFQQMCKLLKIKRINSTAFNPQVQGKTEKFHLGLNQTMSHYVNKYGSDWDEFANYALMAHRANPHSAIRYSPFCLLHGQQMRLPTEDDLTTARFVNKEPTDGRDSIRSHIDTLADRLEEPHRVTRANNRTGRERQKEQYDKGTRLIIFRPGDLIYLRDMTRRKRSCPKFPIRWRGPYEIVRRLSDLNYLVRVARNKEIVVNVNKMKRCYREESHWSPRPTEGPTPEVGNGEGQETTAEEVTTHTPSTDSANSRGSTSIPPVDSNDEQEDQSQDPTWEPRDSNNGQRKF